MNSILNLFYLVRYEELFESFFKSFIFRKFELVLQNAIVNMVDWQDENKSPVYLKGAIRRSEMPILYKFYTVFSWVKFLNYVKSYLKDFWSYWVDKCWKICKNLCRSIIMGEWKLSIFCNASDSSGFLLIAVYRHYNTFYVK